jgi:hypothetical protein
MAEAEMDAMAGLIHDCVVGGKAVAAQCRRLREAHQTVQYGFDLESLGRAAEPGSRSAGQTG